MYFLSVVLLLLLTACSTTVIAPQPQPASQIDMNGQRISHTLQGVHFAVHLAEASIRPSPTEQNYSSFWVEVANLRNVLLPLRTNDFLLIDDKGRQYQPVDPVILVERLTDTAPYLIPSPYVGFYYLESSTLAQSDSQISSQQAYFSSRRPEYLRTEALPETDILPSASVAGAIYFPIELRSLNGFWLRYQAEALTGQKSFSISLPFTVEKK